MFSNTRSFLTGLVFLRRISRALADQNKLLERANELAQLKIELQHPAAYKSYKSNKGRTARVAEISVASVEDWNEQWAKSHPAVNDED